MNTGIIVCTHGKTGIELVNSAKMIIGEQNNIAAVEFIESDSPEDVMDKYIKKIKSFNNCDNVLFLVDLKGGTPFNVAVRYSISNDNALVVTGVNIPMLIQVLMTKEDLSLKELSYEAKKYGIIGIEEIEI
ncbi:PTS sugar transporter subunit IIA [Helcococcus kunzii]|uniref:PTS sugar transporter subunit IIA n=1 Tax=Helcococcus kunzii TaxID=40091 RepID=UPI0024AE0FF1|nr:PTS sugar transporter subunit IIA [Helcococcus kunzii]